MKREHAGFIIDNNNSCEEITLYKKYSGRCMYGKTTTGLVTSCVDTITNIIKESVEGLEENPTYYDDCDIDIINELEEMEFSTDNMALDMIIY